MSGKTSEHFLARTRSARLLAKIPAGTRLVLREGSSKDSSRIGVASADPGGESTVAVLELARTASGTTRARVAGGWTTATTSAGKHLLRTSSGSALELPPSATIPSQKASKANGDGQAAPARRHSRDASQCDRTGFHLVVDAEASAVNQRLTALGPFWSGKKTPHGVMGDGGQTYVSNAMFPELAPCCTWDIQSVWETKGSRRQDTYRLQVEHVDSSCTQLVTRVTRVTRKRSKESTVTFEMRRRPPRPEADAAERSVDSQKHGMATVAFCTSNLGRMVGNGECWTLGQRALKAAGAQPPQMYVWGSLLQTLQAESTEEEVAAACAVLAPGDILQFTSCKFEWQAADSEGQLVRLRRESGHPHHTAVVERVGPPDAARDGVQAVHVLQQNPGAVHRSQYVLGDLSSGTLQLWRPR
jgi:hypothetical protein